MSLWFVTCSFSPAGFQSHMRNYKIFMENMKSLGVVDRVLTVECAFDDKPWHIDFGPNVYHLRSLSVLWQKERLLNYAISLLPDDCEAVCWIDADILFADAGHIERIESSLKNLDVVQCFDGLVRLQPGEQQYSLHETDGYLRYQQSSFMAGGKAVGACWAARREWFNKVGGLFELAITGGGDTVFAKTVIGEVVSWGYAPFDAAVADWAKPTLAAKPRVGVVPGTVCHIWHGELKHRQYRTRHEILSRHAYNPHTDVCRYAGVLEWCSDKSDFHNDLRAYFVSRQEDTSLS